jgi:proline dehydrogenase
VAFFHQNPANTNGAVPINLQQHHGFSSAVTPPSPLAFDNTEVSFGKKSTFELVRAYVVFRLCTVGPLTRNADAVLNAASKVFGSTLVDAVVKRSFFAHFCGGESTDGLRPCINMLNANGINGILDYAAENAPDTVEVRDDQTAYEHVQPAAVYEYTTEADCDFHVSVFKTCIHAVKDVTPQGFAALKLTALGNPKLLERMSIAIVETARLFEKFDIDGDGVVTHEEFEKTYREIFVDGDERVGTIIKRLDPNNTGSIDYVEWSKLLTPADLPRLVSSCVDKSGPLSMAAPNPEELELMNAMTKRLWEVAQTAFDNDVGLLIDAEQSYYQPAIDNYVLKLQKEFNNKEKSPAPIIFNTYQGYLKDSFARVKVDVERAERNNFHFAAKIVRGAYMNAERARAAEMKYESPINETEQDTHDNYNAIVDWLIRHKKEHGTKAEVMVASHNRESIEKAVDLIQETGVDGVHFAQLLGMRDDLTFNLGNKGYKAYKYVPYGKVNEVMPYLIRRAQENSDITKGMGAELKMIEKEFRRRLFG